MKTKAIVLNMTLIALSWIFFSCGPLIFNANFDTDTLGSTPNTNPPGDPSGDTIDASSTGLSVINSPIFESRALQFINTGPFGEGGISYFHSTNIASSNRFLTCAFRIYEKGSLGGRRSVFLVWFSGAPSGEDNTRGFFIRLRNGIIELNNRHFGDKPEDWHVYQEIGRFSIGEKLLFLTGFNRDTMTYTLHITREDSKLNIALDNLDIVNTEFWGKPTYVLGMRFHISAYGSNEAFVVDEVTMTKERMR